MELIAIKKLTPLKC